MHYYVHNIADYRKDTGHLSTLEHGIYRQLIDWYYLDEQPIPAETQWVMRRLRLGSESDAKALQNVLNDFFELREDGWHQARCDAELVIYKQRAERARINGSLGGRRKKTDKEPSGFPGVTKGKPRAKLTNNQEPITTISPNGEIDSARKRANPPPKCPEGVDLAVWGDWLALRKSKKAPVTPTVIDMAQREAGKAGMTLTEFLRVWCARGSQGLQAEWLRPDERRAPASAPAESFRERDDRLARERWEEMTGRRRVAPGNVIDITPATPELPL